MDSLRGWLWWDSTLIDIKSPASDARHPVHRGNEQPVCESFERLIFPKPRISTLGWRVAFHFYPSKHREAFEQARKVFGKLACLKLFWVQYLKWILSCCIKWVAAAAAEENIAWVWNIKLAELPSRVLNWTESWNRNKLIAKEARRERLH